MNMLLLIDITLGKVFSVLQPLATSRFFTQPDFENPFYA